MLFLARHLASGWGLYYARYNGGQWSSETLLASNPPAPQGLGPAVVQDASGKIWVTWSRNEGGDLKLGFVDTNLNGAWDPGEPIVYDTNGNGVYNAGEPVITGPTPTAGATVQNDPRIKFVDANGDGLWESGEFVIYDPNLDNLYDPRLQFIDSNNNNVWDPGETIAYDADSNGMYTIHSGVRNCAGMNPTFDCVIVGALPATNNTLMHTDSQVKFVDSDGDGVWQPGDTLVYDRNNNGKYDTGEQTIAALFNDPKLKFVGSGVNWVPGNSVVYDTNGNGVYDSSIKFVDTNGNGHWDPGETVVYDSNLNGQYDLFDTVIFEAQPPGHDLTKPLKNDPSLRFVDSNSDGVWEPGEAVLYDSNLNGIYDGRIKFVNATNSPSETWSTGKTVVYDSNNDGKYETGRFYNDTIIAGTSPANNTALKIDQLIKFYDKNGNNVYDAGETVVYDSNSNGLYDAETTIAGAPPVSGRPLKSDLKIKFVGPGTTWVSGNTIVYDSNANGLYDTGEPVVSGIPPANQTSLKVDPQVKFVNATTSLSETWTPGKTVTYDSNGNNLYDAETVIAGLAPSPSTGVTAGLGETTVSRAWPSLATTLKTDPKIRFVDSSPYNGAWNPPSDAGAGEDVIYDVNNTGTYAPGDPVLFSNGTLPAAGVHLSTDAHIKYSDTNNNGVWDSNEAVSFDANLSNLFDFGEFVIVGTIPSPGSLLVISVGEPVIAGPTPSSGSVLKTDSKVKFDDQNGNLLWDNGEPVEYDSNNDGVFDTGDVQIQGSPVPNNQAPLKIDEVTLSGQVVSTGSALKSDVNIKFVDGVDNNGMWEQGETVIYDSDGNGLYTAGRFHNDTIIAGPAPASNATTVLTDLHLKYIDSNNNNHWDIGETVVYDSNGNGFYDSPEPVAIVFPTPSTLTVLKTDAKLKYFDPDANGIWDPGESVVYDVNNNGVYDTNETTIAGAVPAFGTLVTTDSHIKYVDTNGDNHWSLGESVVYDSNNNGLYNLSETPIAGGPPAGGTPARVVAHLFYKIFNGTSWSIEQRLTNQTGGDHVPALTQTLDGRIWIAWAGDRGGPTEILYRNTADGVTWTPESLLYSSSMGDTTPVIDQDRNGTIWIVWGHDVPCNCGGGVTFQVDLYAKTSADNGGTWSSPVDLTQNCSGCASTNEAEPSLIQMSDKNLYIFFPIITLTSPVTSNLYYMTDLVQAHRVKMNSLSSSTMNIRAGQTLLLTANVTNNGDYNDSVTVTVIANSTTVASNSSVLVHAGQTMQIIVKWVPSPSGFLPGNYVITARVSDPGESLGNQGDNFGTVPGNVLIRPSGDVNGDCKVNIVDLVLVAATFGKSVGDPGYNPLADLNNDGSVNIADLSIVGSSFGKSC